ncbi:MAG: thioesterase family protein [Oligoflexia bacterium]|nr:thioesterase family protein [Oligoflexia bacterium]
MDRLNIESPKQVSFQTTLQVRVGDVNYGAHLGNDQLLSLVHQARIEMLRSWGWSEFDCGGASLIQAEAAVIYRAQAFLGDELLFSLGFGALSRCGFEVLTQVTRPSDSTEIARVYSGLVCFDYTQKKVVPLPAALKAKISSVGQTVA